MPSLVLVQLLRVNGFPKFYNNLGRSNPRGMIFINFICITYGYGNNGASGLFCHFKASFFKGKHFLTLTAGAFRRYKDGVAGLNLFNSLKYCLHTLPNVIPIKE